jgi:hypothetical protein
MDFGLPSPFFSYKKYCVYLAITDGAGLQTQDTVITETLST